MRVPMIHFGLFWPFKKIKDNFIKNEENRLREKYTGLINQKEELYLARLRDLETSEKELDFKRRDIEVKEEETNEKEKELDFKRRDIEVKEEETNEKELDFKRRDIEDLEKRLHDKKSDLEKANEEIRNQIRLIEAKASPSSVWVESFSHGFSKAWDMMMPIVNEGSEKLKNSIYRKATDETIGNLESVIETRIETLKLTQLKPANDLVKKRSEFSLKLKSSKTDFEKIKYAAYIDLLNWCLNGNNLQKSESNAG